LNKHRKNQSFKWANEFALIIYHKNKATLNINAALSYELFRQPSKQTSAEGTAVDTDSTKERTVFKTVSEAALIYLLIFAEEVAVDTNPNMERNVFETCLEAAPVHLPICREHRTRTETAINDRTSFQDGFTPREFTLY
jgi:hypothetical protein